jgi:hypothetical protein
MVIRIYRIGEILCVLSCVLACSEPSSSLKFQDVRSGMDASMPGADAGVALMDAKSSDASFATDYGFDDSGTSDVGNSDTSLFDSGLNSPDASGADAASLDAQPSDLGWRSQLYPANWTPVFQTASGHQIHDFSYAGYKNGSTPIGVPTSTVVYNVVTQYGADNSGQSDVTPVVQQAITHALAAGGGIVYFPAGDYRFDGQVSIAGSNLVLRGAGSQSSRLFFTSFSGLSYQSHLTFRGSLQESNEQLLVSTAPAHQNELEVADASGYAIGDDVLIGWEITSAFISDHQMTGTWDHSTNAFKYTWQPFFRRQITMIDTQSTPNKIFVDVPLRYSALVRDSASLKKETGYLQDVGVEELALGNAVSWGDAWSENQIHVLEMRGVKDSWIREVKSFDPPTAPTSGRGRTDHLQSSGLLIRYAKRVTVADSEMHGAQNKGGGGNGYLFEVRQSSEILFVDLRASKGRHNFIQNWGFGVSGCVWLRVHSSLGNAWINQSFPGNVGYSEFHHSLAMANLIDQSHFDDGWSIVNRGNWSSYSGHTGTQNVMWNTKGNGNLRSRQFGMGYVIGTRDITVETSVGGFSSGASGTAPEDYTEGLEEGGDMYPQSLYEDQLAKRVP